jgi:putative acetyltransferase
VTITIAAEDPRAGDVVALLERHLAHMRSLSPPGHVHALDLDGLLDPAVTFLAARDDGELVGVAALKELSSRHAELKSMHVPEELRGRGLARSLLDALLGIARERGYERVSLETGAMDGFAPARALYASVGFVTCEPFGDYTVNPYSTCMTLELGDAG